MAEITLRNINKTYPNGFQAIGNLNLEIRNGELLVLVGPSGCGKSTALRMIAGLEEITSGEMRIGDRVVNDIHPRARDIAMVFQNYALYPHMTVRQNIGVALRLAKEPKAEIDAKVKSVAQMLDLTEHLDRKPANLSGGQRQRVAMGRAIVREPSAFLMDEPLSNLDAKLRVQMRSEIARIQKDLGVTTVFVTHDQIEAMTMGDRVAVLKDGDLQQIDTPQVLYNHPDNVFVAGFIGSPAMNLMEVRVEGENTPERLVIGDSQIPLDAAVVKKRTALAEYLGRSVVLGIRPEDITSPGSESPASIGGNISLVESLGAEVFAHFTINGAAPLLVSHDLDNGATSDQAQTTFTARLSTRSKLELGERLPLVFDTVNAHFFDLNSGQAIRA